MSDYIEDYKNAHIVVKVLLFQVVSACLYSSAR